MAVFSFHHVTEKHNALPGHAPPEKASECSVRRRLCRWWAKDYRYPGSIPEPPAEGLSIAEATVGVKSLG